MLMSTRQYTFRLMVSNNTLVQVYREFCAVWHACRIELNREDASGRGRLSVEAVIYLDLPTPLIPPLIYFSLISIIKIHIAYI